MKKLALIALLPLCTPTFAAPPLNVPDMNHEQVCNAMRTALFYVLFPVQQAHGAGKSDPSGISAYREVWNLNSHLGCRHDDALFQVPDRLELEDVGLKPREH